MTAAAPTPTATEPPLMDPPTDADAAGRSGAAPEAPLPGHAPPPGAAGPTLRSQMAENPLATFLGAIVVALLVTMFTTTNVRINRLEDRGDAGFAAVDAEFEKFDAKIDELDAKLTARIDELDAKLTAKIDEVDAKLTAKIDELDRKLTALIAALNATEAVDAAMEGRFIGGP